MYPNRYDGHGFTVLLSEEFQRWLDAILDKRAQVRIFARLRMAEAGNLGDWSPVGRMVSEMRVHVGQGYRLYFTLRRRTIVMMLAGGDKSSQSRDITLAQRLASELDEDP